MKNLALLLSLLLATLDMSAQKKALKQFDKLPVGYSEKIKQTVETETVMVMFGETQTQLSTNSTEYEYHITEVLPNGDQKWELLITRFVMQNSDGNGKEVTYDTQDPDRDTSDIKTRIFDMMVGHPMYMTTSANGKVLTFMGANALFDMMVESYKDMSGMAELVNSIKASYGDEAMVETMRNMWGSLPEKPVKVGASWKETRNKAGMLDLKTSYGYKLKSRNDKEAVIQMKSKTGPIPGKPAQLDMGLMKILYDLKGTGEGATVISQPQGSLIRSEMRVTLKGTMHMSGGGMPKTDVPITTNSTVTTSRM